MGQCRSLASSHRAGVPGRTAMNCFIATVATAGDSVKLPPAKSAWRSRSSISRPPQRARNVFPASGETINALAANTAIAVPPQSVLIFFCGIADKLVDEVRRHRGQSVRATAAKRQAPVLAALAYP